MNIHVMNAVAMEPKNQENGPQETNHVLELSGDIAAVQNWASKKLAYIAAAVAAGAVPPAVDVPNENLADWNDYVQATWTYRLAAYQAIPDAGTPIDTAGLDRAINKLITVERHFLKSMGFFYKEIGASWGFYRMKNESNWARRWERVMQAAAAQAEAEAEASE